VTPLKQRLAEDRAMRDAARANVETDLAILKGEASEQTMAERLLDGGKDLARTLGDGAMDMAGDDRSKLGGVVGLGVAGLVAWFFRGTISDMIDGFLSETQEALAGADTNSEMEETEPAGPDDPIGASDE
jgi:hypothetical protein